MLLRDPLSAGVHIPTYQCARHAGARAPPFRIPLFIRRRSSFPVWLIAAIERDATRLTRGRVVNPNPRRWNGPQKARGPQNSAGNARQQYARYLARAREASLAGDVVEMENCYQHAEHYLRVMRGAGDEQTA